MLLRMMFKWFFNIQVEELPKGLKITQSLLSCDYVRTITLLEVIWKKSVSKFLSSFLKLFCYYFTILKYERTIKKTISARGMVWPKILTSPLRSSSIIRKSSPLLPPFSPITFKTVTGVDILNKIFWSLQWDVSDAKLLKPHPFKNSRTFNSSISSFNADHEPGRDLTEKEWLTVVNPSQRPWTAMCVFDWTVFDGNDVDPEDFPHGGPMIFDGKVTVRDVLTAIAHLKHPFGWFEGIEQLSSGQWQLKFGP